MKGWRGRYFTISLLPKESKKMFTRRKIIFRRHKLGEKTDELFKGQIISECPLEILDFPKIPRNI